MASESFKARLHENQNKAFLYELYELPSSADNSVTRKRRKIIDDASSDEIDVLIKVLKYVITGVIPIRKKHAERVRNSRKTKMMLKHFKYEYKITRKSDIAHKKQILKKIHIYKELLFNLFNL
jgi:hypothetical protein